MRLIRFAGRASGVVGFGLLGVAGMADDLSPVVIASIHDEPRDGFGDTFNESPFEGLLRQQSTREDRAVLEYDADAYIGRPVLSARIIGRVSVNNAFDNGPRSFNVLVYAGNGAADLADFEAAGVVVGSFSYHPPNDTFIDFDVDGTDAVADLLQDGGWIGVRVDCTSEPNFPNILSPATVLRVEAGEPSDCTGLERIGKAKCKQRNGVNKLTVKLAGGLAGDDYTVALSSGTTRAGSLDGAGEAVVKFKRLPSGPGTADAAWGCGATDSKRYDCP
ncbi:MAG: hypothetical protein FLDDKLPJ_02030 [Phycisphaerae bacterium]|nr:hypothetical protein [Phycisphaerae bacterium]